MAFSKNYLIKHDIELFRQCLLEHSLSILHKRKKSVSERLPVKCAKLLCDLFHLTIVLYLVTPVEIVRKA